MLKKIVLNKVMLPVTDMMEQEAMYVRRKGNVELHADRIVLSAHGRVSFNTYFNALSIEKWRTYTNLNHVKLALHAAGYFRVRLCQMYKKNRQLVYDRLYETDVLIQDDAYILSYDGKLRGLLYFELTALRGCASFSGAEYFTEIEAKQIRPVKLAVGICTYHREDYVMNNLDLLSRHLSKPDCQVNLEIFVVDNGHTLRSRIKPRECIHVYENRNCGGTAGFTRCMMEVMQQNEQKKGFTHILLMDDDIIIEWGSLEKTYALLSILKESYKDAFIGGSMLRMDQRNIQTEAGAQWQHGKIVSLKKGYNLCRKMDCVMNEKEEHADYHAWWYCCFPMQIVNRNNLPLPFFMHYDDVEWGLRNMKYLIQMNGICVWHEVFEDKYSQVTKYYDCRNRLICMSLYESHIRKAAVAAVMIKEFLREGFLYRYKGIQLYLKGVSDFLLGMDFLKNTDAEILHLELTKQTDEYGSRHQYLCDADLVRISQAKRYCPDCKTKIFRMLSLNGYFLSAKRTYILPMEIASCFYSYRSKKNVYYEKKSGRCFISGRDRKAFLTCGIRTIRMIILFFLKSSRIQKEYKNRMMETTTLEFWKKYLDETANERSSGESCAG